METLIKRHFLAPFLALIGLISLSGCSAPDISTYANNKPTFDIEDFFSGTLKAHGILKNRSGEVTRYFNATLEGTWKGGVGTLEEEFLFDDGERQHRTWVITSDGNGQYSATANDVIGTSDIKMAGNALFMNYVLQVPYDGDLIEVNVDDRMYLVKDGVVMNESVMKKFGFDVGYLSIVIEKVGDSSR